jgi:predicted MPP superfamily phosphohydrolase
MAHSDSQSPDLRVSQRRFSDRRLALFRAVEATAAALGGRRVYRRRHLRAGRFRLREERIVWPGLAAGLDGLTLAHLSDFHGGCFLGAGDLLEVVDTVNDLAVDLVVLTGDYMTHHVSEALPVIDDLARLKSRLGTFAVFGNHDYKDRLEHLMVERGEAGGIRFLRNACERIELDGGALALTGLEDLEEARVVDVAAARAEVRPGDLEIMLCHNPAGARDLAHPACAAILSGHTHGTQVDLPFLRSLGPKHPGLRVRFGATTLIVNRGLGIVGLPWRHGTPAEVVLVKLVSPEREASCTAASP